MNLGPIDDEVQFILFEIIILCIAGCQEAFLDPTPQMTVLPQCETRPTSKKTLHIAKYPNGGQITHLNSSVLKLHGVGPAGGIVVGELDSHMINCGLSPGLAACFLTFPLFLSVTGQIVQHNNSNSN